MDSKNRKKYDKWKTNIINKIHIIYRSSNSVRHPVPKTFTTIAEQHFTPLLYTCRHFTSSHLNFTHIQFTSLSFGLDPFKFPTAPFHLYITALHLSSLHYTFRWFSPQFCSFYFSMFIIAFLTLFLHKMVLRPFIKISFSHTQNVE